LQRLAIIGSGIAGLGCAHFLHRDYEITLFERNDYVGGHTNTIVVNDQGQQLPIDTGFMVYNEVTYPNLTRLFGELGVVTKPTCMSFGVQHLPTGLEYCGSSLDYLFAQRRNLLNLRFIRMLVQVDRFNREAVAAVDDPRWSGATLQEYVATRGYGNDFLSLYLVPMSAAVWSASQESMLEFPAQTLLRFFHNHGFLGMHTQYPWRTVDGGAQSYVRRLIAPFASRIQLARPVARLARQGSQVLVITTDNRVHAFEKAILACHADQALRLLTDADPDQRRLLSRFSYRANQAILHTDSNVMPKTRRAWASWNYRVDSRRPSGASTVYWMNRLQSLGSQRQYFVSINDPGVVDQAKVLKEIQYHHPLFDAAAVRAQMELPGLNRISSEQTVYFCGSYFRYGFHEDAFNSALDLCSTLLGKPMWKAA